MTLTVMRKCFKTLKPRVINHRSYEHFSNKVFRESLLEKLSQQAFVNNDHGFGKYAMLLLKHWISVLRARQNMLEAIKCPS